MTVDQMEAPARDPGRAIAVTHAVDMMQRLTRDILLAREMGYWKTLKALESALPALIQDVMNRPADGQGTES